VGVCGWYCSKTLSGGGGVAWAMGHDGGVGDFESKTVISTPA